MRGANQDRSPVFKGLNASSQPSADFQVTWRVIVLQRQQQVQAQLPVLHRHDTILSMQGSTPLAVSTSVQPADSRLQASRQHGV